jgi:SAM-dependent methyltransferase
MQTTAPTPQGPPAYQVVGKHAVMPQTRHDEAARFNYLANLNQFLSAEFLPAVKRAYDKRALPRFQAANGRAPQDRREVRELMASEPAYQAWSAMRRATMEQRQQAGRSVVLRQLEQLNATAKNAAETQPGLKLDPDFVAPRYLTGVDHHCMPGGYLGELAADDVSAPANYDVGIFATTGGALGRFSDGGGAALAAWLKREHPAFKPKRILDLGCGLGHNTVPLAQAYPEADVVAIDAAAPMLRYGHARAHSLGVDNIRFVQANAESVPEPDHSFDLITTCMFLHETSYTGIRRVFAETRRLLADGGISLHVEQPQYQNMDVYEQFIRDWDAFNNNEPFWTTMHDMDLRELAVASGFSADNTFETGVRAVVDASIFPAAAAAQKRQEDYGRAAAWYVFGARA